MKEIINRKMKIKSMKPLTKNKKIWKIEDPRFFYIPLLQHIGKESLPLVSKGDRIKRFQKIGETQGILSSVIHSPISGKVTDITEKFLPNGLLSKIVIIENDFFYEEEKTLKRNMENLKDIKNEEILKIIENAGIVGEGGAQFPTHIKFSTMGKKIDTFILNGAECEPYLTCDYILMEECTKELLDGIKIINRVLEAKNIIIVVDKANSALQETFKKHLTDNDNIKIKIVSENYPQGSELLLIKSIFNKEITKPKLPIDVRVIVSNVGTVKSIYDAFINGVPLVERIVTISGEKIKQHGNYLVKIGTPTEHFAEKFGINGDRKNVLTIIGGPMMGNVVSDHQTGITKGSSGILFISSKFPLDQATSIA